MADARPLDETWERVESFAAPPDGDDTWALMEDTEELIMLDLGAADEAGAGAVPLTPGTSVTLTVRAVPHRRAWSSIRRC